MQQKIFIYENAKEQIPKDWVSSTVLYFGSKKHTSIVSTNFIQKASYWGIPSKSSLSLLCLAIGVYTADKIFLRKNAKDTWTREIKINIPQIPTFSLPLFKQIEETITFLTGDNWEICGRESKYDFRFKTMKKRFIPTHVCLFSGGLDSLVGAIDLLESGNRLLLVSHYEGGIIPKIQHALAEELRLHYGDDKVQHCHIFLRVKNGIEPSTRSRSLLFISLGLCLSTAISMETPLIIPENGFIALNCPLTFNRLGSYTTRTTHPYFLKNIQDIICKIGIKNTLSNIYSFKTKGQVVSKCSNRKLLEKLFKTSISCAHPEAVRWLKKPPGSCGYCFPCIIRRASLNTIGWDDASEYYFDICKEDNLLQESKGNDLRAILIKISKNNSGTILKDVLRTASYEQMGTNLNRYTELQKEALVELRRLFEDKGSRKIKKYAGL